MWELMTIQTLRKRKEGNLFVMKSTSELVDTVDYRTPYLPYPEDVDNVAEHLSSPVLEQLALHSQLRPTMHQFRSIDHRNPIDR